MGVTKSSLNSWGQGLRRVWRRGGEGGWMSGKWIPGEVPVLVSGHVGFRTTDSSQGS